MRKYLIILSNSLLHQKWIEIIKDSLNERKVKKILDVVTNNNVQKIINWSIRRGPFLITFLLGKSRVIALQCFYAMRAAAEGIVIRSQLLSRLRVKIMPSDATVAWFDVKVETLSRLNF